MDQCSTLILYFYSATEGKTGKNFGGDNIRQRYIFGGDKYSAEINIRRR